MSKIRPIIIYLMASIMIALSIASLNVQQVYADGSYYKCDNRASQYYRPVFPAFRKHTLMLLQESTEKLVQTIESNIDELTFIGWSPDCRFLAAGIGPIENNTTVIWDLVNNVRKGVFRQKAEGATHYLYWDGSDEYILVKTLGGAFLWRLATDDQIPLPHTSCGFSQGAWDLSREQFLGVVIEDEPTRCSAYFRDQGVRVYDLRTGKEIFFFGNPGRGRGAFFELSSDGKQIKVYANDHEPFGSTVWDRDTLSIVSVDVEKFPGYNADYASESPISPDRHFLAVYYNDYLSIYDLHQPIPTEVKYRVWQYLHVFDIWGIQSWGFTSPTMIAITFKKPAITRHLDIIAGKFID